MYVKATYTNIYIVNPNKPLFLSISSLLSHSAYISMRNLKTGAQFLCWRVTKGPPKSCKCIFIRCWLRSLSLPIIKQYGCGTLVKGTIWVGFCYSYDPWQNVCGLTAVPVVCILLVGWQLCISIYIGLDKGRWRYFIFVWQ